MRVGDHQPDTVPVNLQLRCTDQLDSIRGERVTLFSRIARRICARLARPAPLPARASPPTARHQALRPISFFDNSEYDNSSLYRYLRARTRWKFSSGRQMNRIQPLPGIAIEGDLRTNNADYASYCPSP